MIEIVHASISENNNAGWDGKAKAGDQAREVCVRKWYNKPWGVCLRHPDENVAERAANVAYILAESDVVGYDQSQRNDLYTELKKNNFSAVDYINTKVLTETDCSAFVVACYVCAGVDALKYTGNAPTTRTMESVFAKAGFEILKDKKYLTSDEYLRKGDVLVSPGSHTVIALESGIRAYVGDNTNYFPKYSGLSSSLVEALRSLNIDYSKEYRKKIAEANGIPNYSFGASENAKMLTLLKRGYLVIPG